MQGHGQAMQAQGFGNGMIPNPSAASPGISGMVPVGINGPQNPLPGKHPCSENPCWDCQRCCSLQLQVFIRFTLPKPRHKLSACSNVEGPSSAAIT